MKMEEGDYLAHYGILRKSGRYPWGSGANPHQRSRTFLDMVDDLKKNHGMSEAQIARAFAEQADAPFSVADLKAARSQSVNLQKQEQIRTAQKLKDKGMGASAIARQMGVNESTVRSLLTPGRMDKLDQLQSTANMLKRQVEEKEFLDVGANVNLELGVSSDKFKTALSMLKEEGYGVHTVSIRQSNGETIKYKVLTKPGVTSRDAFVNRDSIRQVTEKSDDRGRTFTDFGIQPPLSISSKRVGVRYKEDGGADADGVIYVRPGVKDVSLGKSRYAQVRIAVDGTHYLKGMAVYKDDLPAGVDLLFNTNKSNTGNKLDALKSLKVDKDTGEIDKDNPFGAVIKLNGQILDKNGKVSSAMNIINEEGDWNTWSRSLSRQVLSKQSPELARSQLDLTHDRRRAEFEEIKGLTNPLIRRKLLESFSEQTDSAAVHLKAANMPRQANKVILPSKHVKPTEVFAPTFEHGERVVLVRFPHAGTFELPELTVNNRTRDARNLLGVGKGGRAPDAVVIHPKVAERLSGADFDGDHVVVIPNNRGKITTQHPLDKLQGFDPQMYQVPLGPKTIKYPDGIPTITSRRKQLEMGVATNLISDMTVKGASSDELARAVRHSMVVIDSEKHNLDVKASARDHGITDLKRKYQGETPKGGLRGASTLITRATSESHPLRRKDASAGPGRVRTSVGTIDAKTGRKLYELTGEHSVRYKDPVTGRTQYKSFRSKEAAEEFVRTTAPSGHIEPRRFESQKLAETDDARTLISDHGGTPIEHVYADHSNRLKAMANEARREIVATKPTPYSPSASKTYRAEVDTLTSKLRIAQRNAPLERQAQVLAAAIVSQRKRANPGMEPEEIRRIQSQAIKEMRLRTGAKKERIQFTDREWEAIQAGAITKTRLAEILRHTDVDEVRQRATPRQNPVMNTVMTSRAKQMLNSGYTLSEVADHLGIKLSTLESSLGSEEGS